MKYRISIILALVYSFVFSQDEINKIIPLAPNTAAFVRYGEVPVNNFTGTTNISIPIYNIKTNEFNIPLELSYHSGGNKVEDIASWVGLGWSLGTIPMISRSVKGIPDEETGGFFSKYTGLSIEKTFMLNKDDIRRQTFMNALADGIADSEPDIFYFNILGKNGKFLYSQEHNQFVTLEESQTKITYENGVFNIVTEEGYEYVFFEKDISHVNNEGITTTWYVSKIISPSKSEEIFFEYDLEVQTLKTLRPITKLIFMGGLPGETSHITEGPITIVSTVHSNVLRRISFNGGVVEFNRNIVERLDLQGGYSLKNIKVKDSKKNEVLSYDLEYKFATGGSCYSKETYTNKWMLLEKFRNTTSLTSPIEHTFFYDESYFPPCRNSPAQDYWGYYNGATDNIDLIPTVFLENRPIEIKGANRFVNPSRSQFGILKKIIYPTGGYTEFDFENNDGYSTKLPDVYLADAASIDSSTVIGLDEHYETTFTINNPPNVFLNGNNPLGGTYGDFSMGCSGCGLKNGIADANINFSLTRLASSSSPAYTFYISRNFRNYLQNGDYILNAYIAGAGQDLEIKDFFVSVTWNKLNPNNNPKNINKYIGGLRVKEIRSYPDALALPITKKYKYKKDYFSDLSSGKVFNEPKFIFEDDIVVGSGLCAGGFCDGYYHRLKSYNNIQQVTYTGANVGYETVIEESNDPNKTGVTIYNYTHSMDFVVNRFPFPPPISMELFRGQPKEISYYKKNGLEPLILIEKKEYEYVASLTNTQIGLFKNMFALKIGKFAYYDDIVLFLPNKFVATYKLDTYELTTNVNLLSSEKTIRYLSSGNLITTKSYNHNSEKHFLLTSQSSKSSTQETLETKYFYPQDPEMASEPFVKDLVAKNMVGIPLSTQNFRGGTKLSEEKTVYDKSTATSNLLLPKYILKNKGATALNVATDKKISYDRYDDKGNLLQYTLEGAQPTSLVWGYNKTLLCAKIENALYSTISSSWINTIQSAVSDEIVASVLNNLRSNFSFSAGNSKTSTYMYKPLIGVTRITDPAGLETYYDYDSFNRLKFVKDSQLNILEAYCYNYKGQVVNCEFDAKPLYKSATRLNEESTLNVSTAETANSEEGGLTFLNSSMSNIFTKNDCKSTNSVPQSVDYVVGVGKYQSTISQEDADAKAQEDLNTNGQAYANSNGRCF